MKTIEYIDAAKRKAGIASDYALAKRLGIPKQTVSNYRLGKSTFENSTAVKIAEILELEPMSVIADIELERAKTIEARSMWERIAKGVAAGVLVALGAGLSGAPLEARAFDSNRILSTSVIHNERQRHRRRRRELSALAHTVLQSLGLAEQHRLT